VVAQPRSGDELINGGHCSQKCIARDPWQRLLRERSGSHVRNRAYWTDDVAIGLKVLVNHTAGPYQAAHVSEGRNQ